MGDAALPSPAHTRALLRRNGESANAERSRAGSPAAREKLRVALGGSSISMGASREPRTASRAGEAPIGGVGGGERMSMAAEDASESDGGAPNERQLGPESESESEPELLE